MTKYYIIAIILFGLSLLNGPITFELAKESPQPVCLTKDEIDAAVRTLSVGSQLEVDKATVTLLNTARKSQDCRSKIVAGLVAEMDKPNLDLKHNRTDYYLWRYGAPILGELRAYEAVDLLIRQLETNDGLWSSTMVHQPALNGLIRMGPLAIPKLSTIVLESPDPHARRDAVFCIASIGGLPASVALKKVLPSQSDPCVSHFVRVSIENLTNSQHRLKDRPKWFSAFLCK
jgi:HEAT repeat protein